MVSRTRRRAALAACATAVAVWLTAPTASAHNVLVDSSPKDGSTVAEAPSTVELVFDQPVQNEFEQVAVLDADETHYEQGEPEVVGSSVSQAISDLPEGDYVVSYRIISADGHPVDGSIEFAVGTSGGHNATAGAEDAEESGAEESQSGISAGWLIGLAALVLAGLAVVVLTAGGRRRSTSNTDS